MAFQLSAAAAAGLFKRSSLGLSESLNIVSKRSTAGDDTTASSITWFVFMIMNVIVLVPTFLFLGYTLNTLLPALAAVEGDDVAPPAYLPISLKDDAANVKKHEGLSSVEESDRPQRGGPLTAGIWATTRFLYSYGGWLSFFRGFGAVMMFTIARAVVAIATVTLAPPSLKSGSFIFADLATVQLSTLWLHTVISKPSSKSLWQRMPGFRASLRATAIPTLAMNLGFVLVSAVGAPYYETTAASDSIGQVAPVAPLVQILLLLLISIPADVVLFRCQASLLPADEETIVPFDRTFGLESVSAKGYASVVEAFKSVSRPSWKRIVMLDVKITLITILAEIAVVGFFVVQSFAFRAIAQKGRN